MIRKVRDLKNLISKHYCHDLEIALKREDVAHGNLTFEFYKVDLP